MNDKGCITVGVRLAEHLRRELGVAPGAELKLSMEQLALVLALGMREGWLRRQEALDSKRSHVPGRLLVNEAPPAGAPPCLLMEALRATLAGAGEMVKAHGAMVETSGIPEGTTR